MSDFYVLCETVQGLPAPLPPEIEVKVKPFSWWTTGGPKNAEIELTGPAAVLWPLLQFLAFKITIHSGNHTPVWWGHLREVLVQDGAIAYGLSIGPMYNKIRVAYTYELMGATTTGLTDWASRSDSIALFGFIKEKERASPVNATPTAAAAQRDAMLQRVGMPVPITDSGMGTGDKATAVFRCDGDAYSLDWRLYGQTVGLEQNNASGGAQQALGQGLVGSVLVGFAAGGTISDVGGRLLKFIAGHSVTVTGSASNNRTIVIESVDNREQQAYTSTGIGADPQDDIHDDNEGLSFVATDDWILTAGYGSSQNNGYKRVESTGANHITVRPATMLGASPGPSISITRGNFIKTKTHQVNEAPGSTVTLTVHGSKIAQSVQLPPGAAAFTINQVEIPIGKVGSPSDSVRLSFLADNSGTPGAAIETTTLAGTSIGEDVTARVFQFSNTNSIQPGFKFWLQLERTGALDPDDFYIVNMDEDLSYTRGALKLWTGSAWVDRTPAASLIFRILGGWDTTKQIQEVVSSTGQLIRSTHVAQTSGVVTNQWREGKATGLEELTDLLKQPTSAGRRLLAVATQERLLRITVQPAEDIDTTYQMTAAGAFVDQLGNALEPGRLPVGHWVRLLGIPPVVASNFRLSPRFLEEATYDPESGKIEPRWQDEPSVWE